MHLGSKNKDKHADIESSSNSNSVSSLGTPNSGAFAPRQFGQTAGDADPGVISEDDDEFVFDNLSHKSSGSSINVRAPHHPINVPPSPLATPASAKTKPPPSPLPSLSPPTTTSTPTASDDIKLRSKTLPPSKPPRITSDPLAKEDEWESKLYGKYLEAGSSESLKRRSWDNSRVLLAAPKETEEMPEISLSSTAPTTPNLEDQKKSQDNDDMKPMPLPRCATLESIVEKSATGKQTPSPQPPQPSVVDHSMDQLKKPEKRISKFKYFRKSKTDSLEDLCNSKTPSKYFNERIIIGHENDHRQQNGLSIEVSKELMKKYEGKSREVKDKLKFEIRQNSTPFFFLCSPQEIILIANDLENDVAVQKMKMKELEDYLDNLLLRVMETQPKLLQNPYRTQSSTKR